MPRRTLRVEAADALPLERAIAAIDAELEVPGEFPQQVLAAAAAAARSPRLPEADCTDIPFLTIDPEGSMDLDQALHIERSKSGFRVSYAIADVAAFVAPGDPVDVEARARGETLYGPGRRVPLHPPVLSEGAASLLPGQVRPALLWTLQLDAAGATTEASVRRAMVKSRERLDYVGAQRQLDEGRAADVILLLRDVGRLREQQERDRGGVSLALPEQEVVVAPDGWSLTYRVQLPVERWNAQISLLTGMSAAQLMVDGKIGLLRTLPPPDPRDVARLRRTATALGISWPDDQDYPAFIHSLDPTAEPAAAAMLDACTTLLRGAGYAAFDGDLPEQPTHAAIAAEYAHATAPLRRLADRHVGEVCVALCAGTPVPDWVRSALPDLPETMAQTGRWAGRYERAVLDLVEAGVLAPLVGRTFSGVITDVNGKDDKRGMVMLRDPAVEAPVIAQSPLPLGTAVEVRLVEADVDRRSVRFELA